MWYSGQKSACDAGDFELDSRPETQGLVGGQTQPSYFATIPLPLANGQQTKAQDCGKTKVYSDKKNRHESMSPLLPCLNWCSLKLYAAVICLIATRR